MAERNIDSTSTDMLSFETGSPRKRLARLVTTFKSVKHKHHVMVFFIDAEHVCFQPKTLPNVLNEIVDVYSAFKKSGSTVNFEPVFFITKVDRVRQDIPTWELKAFVQEIVNEKWIVADGEITCVQVRDIKAR